MRRLLLAALVIGAPQDVIRADTLRRLYGVEVRVVRADDGRMTCLPLTLHSMPTEEDR